LLLVETGVASVSHSSAQVPLPRATSRPHREPDPVGRACRRRALLSNIETAMQVHAVLPDGAGYRHGVADPPSLGALACKPLGSNPSPRRQKRPLPQPP
jgi:hypothetical protein